jgi:hypothetical protein
VAAAEQPPYFRGRVPTLWFGRSRQRLDIHALGIICVPCGADCADDPFHKTSRSPDKGAVERHPGTLPVHCHRSPPSYRSPHLTSLPQLARHSCPKRGVARNATAHLDTVCASHKRHGSSSGRTHVVIRKSEKVNSLSAHVMDGQIPSCLTPPIHTRNGLTRRCLYAIFALPSEAGASLATSGRVLREAVPP